MHIGSGRVMMEAVKGLLEQAYPAKATRITKTAPAPKPTKKGAAKQAKAEAEVKQHMQDLMDADPTIKEVVEGVTKSKPSQGKPAKKSKTTPVTATAPRPLRLPVPPPPAKKAAARK